MGRCAIAPDLALAPSYTLRPATAGDYALLYNLHVACMRDHVAATWGWDEAVQRAIFLERFAPGRSRIVVVDGRDVGVFAVERRADGWFIGNIGIAPAMQGRGIGAAILRGVLADAARDAVPTRLQVLRVNPARRLYERLGFIIEGETPTHYLMVAAPPTERDGGGLGR